jgi:hypothetical protein
MLALIDAGSDGFARARIVAARPQDASLSLQRAAPVGFRVFPLHLNSKTPIYLGWQFHATRDEERIRRCRIVATIQSQLSISHNLAQLGNLILELLESRCRHVRS